MLVEKRANIKLNRKNEYKMERKKNIENIVSL